MSVNNKRLEEFNNIIGNWCVTYTFEQRQHVWSLFDIFPASIFNNVLVRSFFFRVGVVVFFFMNSKCVCTR